jgi:hypothetical protein
MVLENRRSIMNTLKTLMLAAAAVLSLGAGTAMAQDGGGGFYPDWQGQRAVAAAQANRANEYVPGMPWKGDDANGQVQSGSSDQDPGETGADHSATYILNHHLYGAGGLAG